MDMFLKADLKRDIKTPDRNRQQGLRDSRGVAELISGSYRGQSPLNYNDRKQFGKRVNCNRTNVISSSLNVSEILGQEDLYNRQAGTHRQRDSLELTNDSPRSLPHHSQLPPIVANN